MKTSVRDDSTGSKLGSGLKVSWRMIKAFFTQPIVFGKPVRKPDAPALMAARQAERQRDSERSICRDLEALFRLHVESRRLMQHLHRVEQALRGGGIAAMEALPLDVLATALAELERLVRDWSPAGLAELRSRIAVLVKDRPRTRQPDTLPDAPPAAAAPATRVARPATKSVFEPELNQGAEVSEIGHEAYEEMERSWRGEVPKDGDKPR